MNDGQETFGGQTGCCNFACAVRVILFRYRRGLVAAARRLMDKTPAFLFNQLGWKKDNVKDLIKAVDGKRGAVTTLR